MVGMGGSDLIPYGHQSTLHSLRPDGAVGAYVGSKAYELQLIVNIVYVGAIMSDTAYYEMNGIGTYVNSGQGFGGAMHGSSLPPVIAAVTVDGRSSAGGKDIQIGYSTGRE
jgi:hypothetical protein